MVISFSAGFSYSVLMWPRFAVYWGSLHSSRMSLQSLRMRFHSSRVSLRGFRMICHRARVSLLDSSVSLQRSGVSLHGSRACLRVPGWPSMALGWTYLDTVEPPWFKGELPCLNGEPTPKLWLSISGSRKSHSNFRMYFHGSRVNLNSSRVSFYLLFYGDRPYFMWTFWLK